jgi:hypothetical protein
MSFSKIFLKLGLSKPFFYLYNMIKRGRPKEIVSEEPPRRFERTYNDIDGSVITWKYDLDKFENGPIEVTSHFPAGYRPMFEILEEQNVINSKIPLKYQTFMNPKNGKYVAYGRAKQLGLIK